MQGANCLPRLQAFCRWFSRHAAQHAEQMSLKLQGSPAMDDTAKACFAAALNGCLTACACASGSNSAGGTVSMGTASTSSSSRGLVANTSASGSRGVASGSLAELSLEVADAPFVLGPELAAVASLRQLEVRGYCMDWRGFYPRTLLFALTALTALRELIIDGGGPVHVAPAAWLPTSLTLLEMSDVEEEGALNSLVSLVCAKGKLCY